jgi:uncharacterized membrane protein YeaQ/YmgE (transglycosylase-associated protein family)
VDDAGEAHVDLLVFLLVGAIAGWLAGLIVRGFGFGLIGNIVVGIIGALVAGYVFPRLGIGLPAGMIGEILSAAVGAVIVLVIIGLIRRV